MHVFVWGSKTYFGSQGGVGVNVKIYNLFFRYLGEGSKLGIKIRYEIGVQGM